MATANVTKVDYYEVLSVSRDASDQELKTAYRKLAMQYHPDRNPNDPSAEEKFKECGEAYSVLSDPDKRAAYDRYGHAAFQNGGGAGGPFGGGFSGNAQDLGDIFGDLFGEMFNMGGNGRQQASRVQRGRDLRYDMKLEFEEAVFGKEKEITIRRMETCFDCKGSGASKGKAPVTCTQCGGRGQQRFQQGFFSVARTCSVCGGTGTLIVDPCQMCKGETRVQREHTIMVKVPAGVEQDTRIRYSGEGEAGKFAGPAGDLYVVLSVKAHKFFERDGDDLHCVMPISFPQAALGTELEIQTLEGAATIKVPEGTQNGKAFKLKGKGVPHLNSHGKGDLIVEIRVQTPGKLSKQQRELLKQLSETMVVENTPTSRGLFDKVKDMFS
ncbi:molecular chaperone DnaJ [Tunturibacter gelidoferens]|uniref:Chaperone protein DnaJ n=2 Tax=Tunturiibacter gelidiferens TaxID=3069689 RepID=A0AAU7Z6L3_9BACT|nr:molecular chaperone DnaJ [Edaphobacter lichenicola]MBB5339721.1 molecular chaperone DnaJ [Edaphobacter lichenicola]